MLIFLTTARHRYTIATLLESAATPLTGRVLPLSYGEFLSWPELPVGSYLFADVDRLSAADAQAVAARIDALRAACPGITLLNHPLRSLGRLALLEALHAAGINRFRARRADQAMTGLRYPVFIREAVEHSGTSLALIATEAALEAELAEKAANGRRLAELLVIEFVDVRNGDGYFEKYSVLRVGDRYLATDLSFNDRWICKGNHDEAETPDAIALDERFQRENPHVEQLRPIFRLAAIEYGRIDYAFADGALQVFEINSNPMLPVAAHAAGPYRASTERYAAALVDSLASLPGYAEPLRWQPVAGAIGPVRIEAGSRLRGCLRRGLKCLGLLQHEAAVLAALRGRFKT